jgi:hypothetical protein
MTKKDIKMMRKMRVEYVRDEKLKELEKEQQMRGLHPIFDLKVRLGDTPLPEGSVIILTGESE